MQMRTKAILAGVTVAAIGAIGTGVAVAGGDVDVPIEGDALDRAAAAALDRTGGGRVTGSEVGDEESYYEVEVTMPDGRQIDVQLDESFNVVGATGDTESADSDGDG
jgi:hypothetical protein